MVGLSESEIGVPESIVGLSESEIGDPESIVGLSESKIGVPESEIDLPEAVCDNDLREIGLKYPKQKRRQLCHIKIRENHAILTTIITANRAL